MKKNWFVTSLLILVALGVAGAVYVFAPHEMAIVYPNAISAFGYIDGLAQGMKLDVRLSIENPSLSNARISLKYARPSGDYEQTEKYVGEKTVAVGSVIYRSAPADASEWITLDAGMIDLKPLERRTVILHITTPKDIELPKYWQFFLVAKDEGQSGLVQTQNICRCLVTMR